MHCGVGRGGVGDLRYSLLAFHVFVFTAHMKLITKNKICFLVNIHYKDTFLLLLIPDRVFYLKTIILFIYLFIFIYVSECDSRYKQTTHLEPREITGSRRFSNDLINCRVIKYGRHGNTTVVLPVVKCNKSSAQALKKTNMGGKDSKLAFISYEDASRRGNCCVACFTVLYREP